MDKGRAMPLQARAVVHGAGQAVSTVPASVAIAGLRERVRQALEYGLAYEVERDTLACDLTPDEQLALADAAIAVVFDEIWEPTHAMTEAAHTATPLR